MNILFETQFGSHIYGTNTINSDLDYKGIYKAEYRDIILGRVKESIHTSTKKDKSEGVRNQAGDIDREYKELRRFIKDAMAGQTYALDMLYTPKKHWTMEPSPIWLEVVENRRLFLSKSMNAFIGYIRQQTGKYAMKGTRLEAVITTIEFLKGFDPKQALSEVWNTIPRSEFVYVADHEFLVNHEKTMQPMLNVLEKKFQKNVPISFVVRVLEKFYKDFGGRSKAALENQGVDWKAISHAYRACYQLLDIATYREILFPLTEATHVLNVKLGKYSYKDRIQHELPELMDQAISSINKSSLPESVDPTFWESFIVKTYET